MFTESTDEHWRYPVQGTGDAVQGVRFRVLGPVQIVSDGVAVPVGGPKMRAFLASLLLHKNRAVPLAELVDMLWGADPPASAVANLRVYAAELRRILQGVEPARSSRLVAQAGCYRFTVGPDELDTDVFENLASRGRSALRRIDLPCAVALLREALGQWRGHAAEDLAGFPALQPYLWAWEERRLSTWEDLLEACIGMDDFCTAVHRLRELVARHPYRERSWSLLVLALYRSGDTAAALTSYMRARAQLQRELGIEPGPQLQRLHQAVLRRDPRLEPSCAINLPEIRKVVGK